MNRWFALLGAAALLILAIAVGYRMLRPDGQLPEVTAASSSSRPGAPGADGRISVAALGRVVPRGGIVDLGAIAGNRVAELLVGEGQDVKAGDPLVYLQDHPLRQTELEYAQQQSQEAQEKLRIETEYAKTMVHQAEIAYRQAQLQEKELQAQAARIELLETNLQVAQTDLERLQGLDEQVISPQEREHQKLRVTQAQQELSSAQATFEKAKATEELNVENAQTQLHAAQINLQRVAIQVPVRSFEENVKLAQQKLEQSIVRAPTDGRILKIVTHPGEVVGQRPILQLGNVSNMEVLAEVYETDISQVRVGQHATATSRALPKPLEGTVQQIGSMVAQNEVMSLDPAARADARVVQVEIALEDSAAAAGLVNLQVDVTIDVYGEAKPAHRPTAAAGTRALRAGPGDHRR